MMLRSSVSAILFLSTPSARRATALSPCLFELFLISIHALREEGDAFASNIEVEILNFYPRPPRGGRPIDQQAEIDSYLISIHALREEGDTGEIRRKDRPVYFYPRPPRGGRHTVVRPHGLHLQFLSTPSARRATVKLWRPRRRGSVNFYPRPPRGGRPNRWFIGYRYTRFLSTPSARRATGELLHSAGRHVISIHALREEGDGSLMVTMPFLMRFLSTPSARRATWWLKLEATK